MSFDLGGDLRAGGRRMHRPSLFLGGADDGGVSALKTRQRLAAHGGKDLARLWVREPVPPRGVETEKAGCDEDGDGESAAREFGEGEVAGTVAGVVERDAYARACGLPSGGAVERDHVNPE